MTTVQRTIPVGRGRGATLTAVAGRGRGTTLTRVVGRGAASTVGGGRGRGTVRTRTEPILAEPTDSTATLTSTFDPDIWKEYISAVMDNNIDTITQLLERTKEPIAYFDSILIDLAVYLGYDDIAKLLGYEIPPLTTIEYLSPLAFDYVRNYHMKLLEGGQLLSNTLNSSTDSINRTRLEVRPITSITPTISLNTTKLREDAIPKTDRYQADPERKRLLLDLDFLSRFGKTGIPVVIISEMKTAYSPIITTNIGPDTRRYIPMNYKLYDFANPKTKITDEDIELYRGKCVLLVNVNRTGIDNRRRINIGSSEGPSNEDQLTYAEQILADLDRSREHIQAFQPLVFSCRFELPWEMQYRGGEKDFFSGMLYKVPWSKTKDVETRLIGFSPLRIVPYSIGQYVETLNYYNAYDRLQYYRDNSTTDCHCESCSIERLIVKNVSRRLGKDNVAVTFLSKKSGEKK